jgi:PAS domain S-box-containing protein
MKINTRLRLNTFISSGVIILILFSLIWSFQEVSRASRNMNLVAQMQRVAFERIILRDDYLLFREDRARIQWNAKSEAFKGLLESASKIFTGSQDNALLKAAREQFDETLISFGQFMEEHTGEKSSSRKGMYLTEAESILISEVYLKAYALRDSLDRLHASAEIARNTAQNKGILIILLSIIGGFIAIIINSTVIGRTVTKRIAALSKGVEIISAGDLDYHIVVEGSDELSALALESNEMAAKLKRLYTSVDNLQREIVERQRIEGALRESEARISMLLENLPQKIFMKDRNHRWVSINEKLAQDFGIHPEEVVGKVNADLFPKELADKYYEDDKRIMETGQTEDFEERYFLEDKMTWVQTIKTPVRDKSGNIVGLLGIFWDITARKNAEDQLRRTLADLERSNKELEQFAYVASHDLQEPLRMVASYTQLLAQRYQGKLDDRARKYINYAVDGAVRMQLLINDLLTYSRIGTKGKPLELTDAHTVLGEAINNLKMNIDEARATIINDELPEVRVDASQLVQLFQNLIINAVKFRGEKRPHVHISARDEGREWLFSVRDNGIGIDQRYADKLFVIFQRLHTKEEYPGSGIGLAICKKIVGRHGGRIWFESVLGKGTTFYFTIPK